MALTVKQMMEWGKNNPNDPRATQLREQIQSGSFDKQAQDEGFDLTGKSPSFEAPEAPKSLGEKIVGGVEGVAQFVGIDKLATGAGAALASGKVAKLGEEATQKAQTQQTEILSRIQEAKESGDTEKVGKLEKALEFSSQAIEQANQIQQGFIEDTPSNRQVIGSAVNLATLALSPGAIGAASKVAGTAARVGALGAVGAAEGAALTTGTTLSEDDRLPTAGELGTGAAIGAIGGTVLPGVVKFAAKPIRFISKKAGNVIQRVLKGLGAPVEEIADNPQAIDKALKRMSSADKSEVTNVLREETKTFVDGANSIRRDARHLGRV